MDETQRKGRGHDFLPPAATGRPDAHHRAWAESLDGPALTDRLTRLSANIRWCSPAERAALLTEAAARVGLASRDRGLAWLDREVRSMHAALANGLTTRRDHPTYGYSKASLREMLARLTGLVTGHMIASGAWYDACDPIVATHGYAASRFDIDLRGLDRAIKEAR
jgi:hypothetical protein